MIKKRPSNGLGLAWLFVYAVLWSAAAARADNVPSFDVAQSCHRGESYQIGTNPFEACMRKESDARNELMAQWSQFPQADKTACIELCKCGGVAGSYIELLTCLQMRTKSDKFVPKPANSLPKSN